LACGIDEAVSAALPLYEEAVSHFTIYSIRVERIDRTSYTINRD
jgi:hypothetical protein